MWFELVARNDIWVMQLIIGFEKGIKSEAVVGLCTIRE